MDETPGAPPEQPPAAPPPGQPSATPPPTAAPPSPAMAGDRPGPVNDTSKLLAAFGYLIGIIAIVMLFIEPYKDEKFVKFHAVQAVALFIISIVAWMIPVVGWIVGVVVLVFQIIALIKTFQGEYYEVPLIYNIVKGYIGEK